MKTNNSKRKLTRNSFKRKIILFGVVVFMSVAMVATGFAAWIISANATVDANVGVNVGTVTEANVTITLDNVTENEGVFTHNNKFVFDPVYGDIAGRVKGANTVTDPDATWENLKITISGTIGNAQSLGNVIIDIDFGEKLEAAAAAGYIVLPDSAGIVVTHTDEDDDDSDGVFEATFTYDIVISWGALFAGINPGYFYDCLKADGITPLTDADLANAKYATVTAIQALTLANIKEDLQGFYDAVNTASVVVTVTATVA